MNQTDKSSLFSQEGNVCLESKAYILLGWKLLEGGAGPLAPSWVPASALRA